MWTKIGRNWELKAPGYVHAAAGVYTYRQQDKLVCSTRCGWRRGPEFKSVGAAKAWCEAAVAENNRATGKRA